MIWQKVIGLKELEQAKNVDSNVSLKNRFLLTYEKYSISFQTVKVSPQSVNLYSGGFPWKKTSKCQYVAPNRTLSLN